MSAKATAEAAFENKSAPTQEELQAEIAKLEAKLVKKADKSKAEIGFLASCKAKAKAGIAWTLDMACEHPYLATALIFASGMALGAYAGYSSGVRNARVTEAFAKAGFTPME